MRSCSTMCKRLQHPAPAPMPHGPSSRSTAAFTLPPVACSACRCVGAVVSHVPSPDLSRLSSGVPWAVAASPQCNPPRSGVRKWSLVGVLTAAPHLCACTAARRLHATRRLPCQDEHRSRTTAHMKASLGRHYGGSKAGRPMAMARAPLPANIAGRPTTNARALLADEPCEAGGPTHGPAHSPRCHRSPCS